MLLVLASSREVCQYTVGGGKIRCTSVAQWPYELMVGALGGIVLAVGLWVCWTVFEAE